jgi:monoterpene epsilon-lactone hydrolase
MTTIHHPLTPADATVVASLRQAMSAQKGKYMGTGARQPFEAQKNGVQPAECQTTPGIVGGVSGWWCHPANPRPDAALIYYHGGWYMLGTAESFRNQASHYAVRTRTSTFVPDYRRAPEAPFPAAYDDALAVYLDISKQDGRKIALVGDSVGGALSLLVLAAAAAKPDLMQRPLGAVAMSPVTDLTLSSASMQTRAQADPIFTRDMVANFVEPTWMAPTRRILAHRRSTVRSRGLLRSSSTLARTRSFSTMRCATPSVRRIKGSMSRSASGPACLTPSLDLSES